LQALLASLVVSMGVKDNAYKTGMAAARAEAKKTQQDFDKSTDGMASAVERTAKRVNQAAIQIADAVAAAGAKVRTTGLALTAGLTLGLGGLGKVSKDAAANFQASMNRVRAALTDITPEQLSKLSVAAQELGPAAGKSAVEAADAIEGLARNGLSASQILGGALKASLNLSVVGYANLGDAADLTTDIMQQFSKQASDLDGVVDKLTGGMNVSKFAFDDYRLAMGQTGGVAGGLGFTFEDTNVALAATASLFASGSDAGTSFKTFLTSLNPKSKEAAALMEQLGISFFDATGNAKPLSEIADVLRDKLSNLSDRSKNKALETLFGTDAMRTAIGLMNQGSDGLERIRKQIDAVRADQQLAIVQEGEIAATQRLATAWERVKIAVGNAGLVQAFTAVKNSGAAMLNAIGAAPPWFLKLGVAIGAVAAATGPMIIVGLTLAKVMLPLLLLRLGPVALGFAALINPMGVIIRLLGQLALQAGASTLLGLLGTRMLALAGPVGLAISLLTLFVPLLMKTGQASEAATSAGQQLSEANGAAAETVANLATATDKARDAVLKKAKADKIAAAQALVTARNNLVAARAELARANASAPTMKTRGQQVLGALAVAGFDPTGMLPRTGSVVQARTEVAQRTKNATTAEATFNTLDAAIKTAEGKSGGAKIDLDFGDEGSGRKKGGAGKSAADLAREAARNDAQYQDDLGRLRVERLRAEADLSDNARARSRAELASIDEERASYARQLANDEGLGATKRATLLAAKDAQLEIERMVAQRDLTDALTREEYDLAKARNDTAQDEVRARLDMVDSLADRRAGELRLLELQRQQEEADLDLILATKATSSAEWQNALDRKQSLDTVYARRTAGVMRGNETSGEAFNRELNRSGAAIGESIENAGVDALRGLNSELSDAILSAKSLGDVFANTGRRIVASLLDIGIQQMLIKPLAKSLFGDGGGGGFMGAIGSFFGSKFGGSRKSGGGISAGSWYNVGEDGPERFYPGISGTIVPNDGRGAGPAAGGIARIEPSPYFNAVVDGRVVRGALPIAQASTATGMQQAGRSNAWRARQTVS
jgi:TP901 family phage tail tape measure protein